MIYDLLSPLRLASPRLASSGLEAGEIVDSVLLTSYSVVGLNLLDPGSAPKVIKTWDDRLEESGVESGVDDEVGGVGRRPTLYPLPWPFVDRPCIPIGLVLDMLRVPKLQATSSLDLLSTSIHATTSHFVLLAPPSQCPSPNVLPSTWT
jgi:hypothetical protein